MIPCQLVAPLPACLSLPLTFAKFLSTLPKKLGFLTPAALRGAHHITLLQYHIWFEFDFVSVSIPSSCNLCLKRKIYYQQENLPRGSPTKTFLSKTPCVLWTRKKSFIWPVVTAAKRKIFLQSREVPCCYLLIYFFTAYHIFFSSFKVNFCGICGRKVCKIHLLVIHLLTRGIMDNLGFCFWGRRQQAESCRFN